MYKEKQKRRSAMNMSNGTSRQDLLPDSYKRNRSLPTPISPFKRIALDDNLAIALVFNTDKQMYIYFEMTFVLYSENQEQ